MGEGPPGWSPATDPTTRNQTVRTHAVSGRKNNPVHLPPVYTEASSSLATPRRASAPNSTGSNPSAPQGDVQTASGHRSSVPNPPTGPTQPPTTSKPAGITQQHRPPRHVHFEDDASASQATTPGTRLVPVAWFRPRASSHTGTIRSRRPPVVIFRARDAPSHSSTVRQSPPPTPRAPPPTPTTPTTDRAPQPATRRGPPPTTRAPPATPTTHPRASPASTPAPAPRPLTSFRPPSPPPALPATPPPTSSSHRRPSYLTSTSTCTSSPLPPPRTSLRTTSDFLPRLPGSYPASPTSPASSTSSLSSYATATTSPPASIPTTTASSSSKNEGGAATGPYCAICARALVVVEQSGVGFCGGCYAEALRGEAERVGRLVGGSGV